MKRSLLIVLAGIAMLLASESALPCSLCSQAPPTTYRQELATSKLILFGTVTHSEVNPADGKGNSSFRIDTVIKSDPWLDKKTTLEVPRYIPKDTKLVLFCDIYKEKLDAYRGVPVKSDAAVAYVKGLLDANRKGTADVLRFAFDYLEHSDPELAADAYLEFAVATDRDIGGIASKLSAEKLRGWLKDTKTPEQRLAMYAFLLGGCGGEDDARLLRELIDKPTERTANVFDGLLGGYIQLRPREGWELALSIIKDEKKPFAQRFAVVRLLRFYHGWKPDDARDRVMQGMAAILGQSDIADIAVEDLRRWENWELTGDVLALYRRKGYDAPLMQRALVRYALICPRSEAKKLADDVKRSDPDLYNDVADSLRLDKK